LATWQARPATSLVATWRTWPATCKKMLGVFGVVGSFFFYKILISAQIVNILLTIFFLSDHSIMDNFFADKRMDEQTEDGKPIDKVGYKY
jgi:uncharacterized membrane protein